jgi:hypothetical protein
MPAEEFASQVVELNVKVLMVMGRNAVAVCGKIRERFELNNSGKTQPFILAL